MDASFEGGVAALRLSSFLQLAPDRVPIYVMDPPAGRGGVTSVPDSSAQRHGRFPSTHWTVVVHAGKGSSIGAREAFGQLYKSYQPALVAFLRSNGRGQDDAEELVQGFFEFLLQNASLGKVRPNTRFRSWLLKSLKCYMSDLWDKARAKKRGGGQAEVPLGTDIENGEVDPPNPGTTPDKEFDRQFALRFIELVMQGLEREYAAFGKAKLFQCLQPWLLEKKGGELQAEVGRRLGMKEATVNVEVSRLRKRYRAIFDKELLNLVGRPEELAEEKNFLFAAVRQ